MGAIYQPLRKEFWNVPEYIVRDSIKHIMITFGGNDITNKTLFYLKKVLKYYPKVDITVIIGKGFTNIGEILEYKNKQIEFVFNADALSMRNIMLQSDLCISAAGQTISELARMGVPTIGVQVAENQKNNIKYWQESGFLFSENKIRNNPSLEERKRCSAVGRDIIDGQGVKRLVERVLF